MRLLVLSFAFIATWTAISLIFVLYNVYPSYIIFALVSCLIFAGFKSFKSYSTPIERLLFTVLPSAYIFVVYFILVQFLGFNLYASSAMVSSLIFIISIIEQHKHDSQNIELTN